MMKSNGFVDNAFRCPACGEAKNLTVVNVEVPAVGAEKIRAAVKCNQEECPSPAFKVYFKVTGSFAPLPKK